MFRCVPFVLLLCALPLAAQDDPAKKVDPEIPGLLQKLKEAVLDKKFEKEQNATEAIDKLLVKQQAGLGEKDKQAVVKGLEMVLTQGKLRDHDKAQIYVQAAAALAYFGAEGAKVLRDAYDSKRYPDKPDWVSLREWLLKDLGKTKDEGSMKFLLNVARRSPVPALQAAAGEALGNYEGSDQKVRKEILTGLIATLGEIEQLASVLDSANIEAQNARDRRAVIADKWNTTMSRLTKQNFRKFLEWQQWLNENKGKDWK